MKLFKIVLMSVLFLAGCTSKPTVEDTNLVKKQIEAEDHKFKACQKKYRKIDGRLLLNWQINQNGHAQNIEVAPSSTVTNKKFIKCMTDVVGQIQFVIPTNGQTIDVKHPWLFGKDAIEL